MGHRGSERAVAEVKKAWLAWSRFRVVIPAWDQQLGTLTCCLDQAKGGENARRADLRCRLREYSPGA